MSEHEADWRARRPNAKSHFVALLYGQISEEVNRPEIDTGLASRTARLYRLGCAAGAAPGAG